MIKLTHLCKTYPGSAQPAIRDLSLDIDHGEFCTFVGPSGCGKTTILRMINQLDIPDSGDVYIQGVRLADADIIQVRRQIGFVMQSAALFPHRTVAQNIATVPRLAGWSKARIRARIDELVALMSLDSHLLHRYPHQLSGGQQGRVAIARAIAADPPILLMDEPFAAIDPVVRERLQDELLLLQQRLQKTIVLVTHDINEAIRLGDKIAIFQEGGVLAQFDTPDRILAHPASEFVRRFIGPEPNLKRLGMIQVGQLPRHDVPLLDERRSPAPIHRWPARCAWCLTASDARCTGLIRSGVSPCRWSARSPAATACVLPIARCSTWRPACWCMWMAKDNTRGRCLTPCCSKCSTARWGCDLMIDWSWVIDNHAMIGDLLWQHARMVLLALLFGSLLTGGLLAMTLRWPATAQPLITLCGVLFTIPSLALFILLLPFTGLSLTTSLIGLTLYSLLILLRNVLAGMEKLPQAALESARALGYTRGFRFFDIELWLLLPSLFAGLRIASVTLVGLVTVTALIGQGGLGQLLLAGFNQDFLTPIVVSLVLSLLLSLVFDGLIARLGDWLTPWTE